MQLYTRRRKFAYDGRAAARKVFNSESAVYPQNATGGKVVFAFEVFIQRGSPRELDWQNFFDAIFEYEHEFDLEIEFGGSVNFHLFSKKDLSHLATKIMPFVLKDEKRDLWRPNGSKKSMHFLLLPTDKSILEIKENEGVKKGRTLKRVVWHLMKYLSVRASVVELYFEDKEGNLYVAKRTLPDIPLHLVQGIDWSAAVKYKKKDLPVYLKLEKSTSLFNRDKQMSFLEIDGFPYLHEQEYLGVSGFEFDKHTLIVGQTGVGKSKFIALLIKELVKWRLQDKYTVVVVDPHASLFSDFASIPNALNVDFRGNACDLFFQNAEPKVGAELTIMLFKTLLKDQFSGRMEQILKYSLFALLATGDMSLFNLRKFLTEMSYRTEILGKMENAENITHFFDTEFVEITTKYYDQSVMPVLTLIDELNFLPVFGGSSSIPVEKALRENFLTTFSLSRIFLGDRATKLIAGLLIQQIFLIAQTSKVNKKIILIIDEVPVVETESLITILAEARKFNLSLFLSMQHLAQVSEELLKGILSNVYNYFVFKVNEEDARLLEKNLQIEIPDEVIKNWESIGENKDDLKVKLITNLDVRECLVRAYTRGKFFPCFKGKTLDLV